VDVVRLFSLLHDCQRESDSHDPEHGRRAAELARHLNGRLFVLRPERLELLAAACAGHADGLTSPDPTIGTCWDADRLDLPRVSLLPEPKLLSTAAAREREMIRWAADLCAADRRRE
jgi:uncharacterized protein